MGKTIRLDVSVGWLEYWGWDMDRRECRDIATHDLVNYLYFISRILQKMWVTVGEDHLSVMEQCIPQSYRHLRQAQ
jgi:hypothetical protein